MTEDALQRRADALAARVEALAEALRACGVPAEASAQLLSRASTAVLHALNLELLLEAAAARRTSRAAWGEAHELLVGIEAAAALAA